MNKLIHLALLLLAGLVILAATSQALVALAGAVVTPLLVAGIIVALLRCVWFYTR